ncbi:MAG: methyltransferase domain-containing protein [Acetatifactor sp.]|nr:methyltransferase domain-containing protein [Acetatifactor sp.]
MKDMTIIMVLHNEAEYAKYSIQSIRMFADVEQLSIVVVDNHSEDALAEWAREQEDITYVYMDEGKLPFGQVVNLVCSALQIDSDLLIMDAHYMLTPHALSRMQALLYQEESIGAVGGVSNSFSVFQCLPGLADYEAAVSWADGDNANTPGKCVLGLHPDVILLKASMISQFGSFDEELASQEYVMKDLGFRMVMNDWKLQFCPGALFWDMRGDGPYHSGSKAEEPVLERKWGMHYFNATYNANLVDLIGRDKDAPISVLEIGCDCGATLLEIRNRYPQAAVYGIELNEQAAMVASHVANVQKNNIEEQNIDFSPHAFDYIIFGDVLEHLHDPLKTIQYCRGFLKDGGYILASIPNLMHISVIEDLLQGNFTYTETGLLDKTHIHFFTFNEIVRMFNAGGYEVEDVRTVVFPITAGQEVLLGRLLELQKGTSRYMYEALQYVVCARASISS